MSNRALAWMTGALVLLAVPAVWLYTQDQGAWGADRDQLAGEVALPALADISPTDLVAVELVDRDGSVRFESANGRWILPERGGYPARAERVAALVRGIQSMRLLAPGTSKPEKHAQVGLVAPSDGGEDACLVRFLGPGDVALAEILLGSRANDRSESATWIRRPGEDQTFIASGAPPRDTGILEWIDRTLVSVSAQRVRSVTVDFANDPESGYSLARENQSGFGFDFEPLPEGRELVEEWRYSALARALASLQCEDVVRAESFEHAESEAVRVRFVTHDGLVVELDARRLAGPSDVVPGPVWVSISARADEPVGPVAPGEAPTDRAAVEAEARDIQAHNAGWWFRLPAATGANLFRAREELLVPLPIEELPIEPGPPEDGSVDGGDTEDAPEEPAVMPPDEVPPAEVPAPVSEPGSDG